MEMGKETYSKNCKDSQTHITIEIKMKLKNKICSITGAWHIWYVAYLEASKQPNMTECQERSGDL